VVPRSRWPTSSCSPALPVSRSAAKDAGHSVTVPFTPGRTDATQEMTDAESFTVLEPLADGMRNYVAKGQVRPAEQLMVDKANLLTLSAPEMTVLVAGMRAIGTNADGSDVGVLTTKKGQLTNDYFVNLLDMSTKWEPTDDTETLFEGKDRKSGEVKWTASRMDLVFGSNSQLRAWLRSTAQPTRRKNSSRTSLPRGTK
jgi:catalase-peroxidase